MAEWTGKPGVLQSMGSQRVRHDWVTELNWRQKGCTEFVNWQLYPCLPAGYPHVRKKKILSYKKFCSWQLLSSGKKGVSRERPLRKKKRKNPTRLLSEPVGLSAYRKLNRVIKGKCHETVSIDLRRKPIEVSFLLLLLSR